MAGSGYQHGWGVGRNQDEEDVYGVVAPRVKHPTLAEKVNVKPYFKNDMVHMMLKLKYVLSMLPNS
jgi:hypothetical protein